MAFRLTSNEYDIISWAANIQGMSLSEYVRLCALERAGQTLVTIDQFDTPDQKETREV